MAEDSDPDSDPVAVDIDPVSVGRSTLRFRAKLQQRVANGGGFGAASWSVDYDPATTGEAPITWRQEPDASPARPERVLGFGAADIGTALWLPDDPDGLVAALQRDGRSFNGAFVPLVIHDPVLAERSFDAAEWAADLIRGESGQCFCITPFANKGWVAETPLSPRQWNHTAAMIERLDELCKRYRLQALVSDQVGDEPVRPESALDPDLPIHFVLDAGNFLNDGFLPATLVSPERIDQGGHTVARFPVR